MQLKHFEFTYEVYEGIEFLSAADKNLLLQAQEALSMAYVPYSHFKVGAAALLSNQKVYKSANQENASYPVTICAERTLLGTISSLQPGIGIHTCAITYEDEHGNSQKPISPCGMCRQALLEYEQRNKQTMRIILGGKKGQIFIINGIQNLLPLSFTQESLG